jgi:hypothetical protein
LVPKGGLIFGILTENVNLSASSNQSEVMAWIGSENAPNTWVHETVSIPSDGVEGYFMTGRDSYILLDLSTMKIVAKYADEPSALADLKSRVP